MSYPELALHTFTTKPWSISECIENYARRGIGGISVWRETIAGGRRQRWRYTTLIPCRCHAEQIGATTHLPFRQLSCHPSVQAQRVQLTQLPAGKLTHVVGGGGDNPAVVVDHV